MSADLLDFVRESNRIEGIYREPTNEEIGAHRVLLGLAKVRTVDIGDFVSRVAPHAELRDRRGLDVRVGNHIPIRGGALVPRHLKDLLDRVNAEALTPFAAHVEYETLHPFTDGNGRSGRALWLWMMNGDTTLGFLHRFYYQTLDAKR